MCLASVFYTWVLVDILLLYLEVYSKQKHSWRTLPQAGQPGSFTNEFPKLFLFHICMCKMEITAQPFFNSLNCQFI